jgi:hypothetical protein
VYSKSHLANTSLGDAYDVVFEDGHILKDVATTGMRSVDHVEDGTYQHELFTAFRAGLQRSIAIQRVLQPFKKGDEVEALWDGGAQYWVAHVTAVLPPGAGGGGPRYQVTYLDKQTEVLEADSMRLHAPKRTLTLLPRLEKKVKVATRWVGGNFWESKITGVHVSAVSGDTKYEVLYTDGTPERGVLRSNIRELRCEARDLLGSIVRVGWPVLVRDARGAGEWAMGTVKAIEDTKAVIDACENPTFRLLMEDGSEVSEVPYTSVLFDDSKLAEDGLPLAAGTAVLLRLRGEPTLIAGRVEDTNAEGVLVSIEATGRTVCVDLEDLAPLQLGDFFHAGLARAVPSVVHPGAVPLNDPGVEVGDVVWAVYGGNSWYRAVVLAIEYDGVGPSCDAACSLRYLDDGSEETLSRSLLLTAPPWEWLGTDLDAGDQVAVCVLETGKDSCWRVGTVFAPSGENRYIVHVREYGEVHICTVPRHCICELHDVECPDVFRRPVRVGDVVRVRHPGDSNLWQPALLTTVTTTEDDNDDDDNDDDDDDDDVSVESEHDGDNNDGEDDDGEDGEDDDGGEDEDEDDYEDAICKFTDAVVVTFADGLTASVRPEDLWWDPALTMPIFVALQSEHAKKEKRPPAVGKPAAEEEMETD